LSWDAAVGGLWFIFRRKVVRYELWVAAMVYGIRSPAELAQVRTAESIGAWIRGVLLLVGLLIILLPFILR
jgi:hypothetical protein